MTADREEKIRKAAYEIWLREGSPEGRDREHWDEAERELARDQSAVHATSGDQSATEQPRSGETAKAGPDSPLSRPGRKGA